MIHLFKRFDNFQKVVKSALLVLGLLFTFPSVALDNGVQNTFWNDHSLTSATGTVMPVSLLINEAVAEEEEEEEEGEGEEEGEEGNLVPPVTNATYTEECGSCHLAYQPIFLPVRSWENLMNTLNDHFGDNAELEADTQKILLDYLVSNAAEQVKSGLSTKLLKSLPTNQTLRRITEIPYIKREHRELSKKKVENNPEVKSLSYCNKCHRQAEKGSYAEREIDIPGYGRRH